MPDANNIFEQIQSLCRDFRRQLKRGETKRIEDYLSRVDASAQENLFQNLLMIDVNFRQQQEDDKPTAAEYQERFPQFSKLVRHAFLEDLSVSQDREAASPDDETTVVPGLPDRKRLGDYELMAELGHGGFGVVYKARHVRRNDVVALKTLRTMHDGQSVPANDADRLHKFRREFRSLSNINHPNLIGMQTLEVDGDQWFFTMDLIDGTDFLNFVRPDNALDETRLRAALPQLVTGISALHTQHIVHRDLKPSNVMVDATGHVVILDFGLLAELQDRLGETVSMRSGQFAGTLPYAAPEQLSGQRPAAADWYAMGVMIYEALTGERPFSGSPTDLIVQKQTLDAPTLSSREDLPSDLTDLVDQLLKRKPEERPTATSIASSLSVDEQSESSDSVDADMLTDESELELILIGREDQLAQLEAARQEVLETRKPVVVWITGLSGEGKSSLAEKFLASLRKSTPLSPDSGERVRVRGRDNTGESPLTLTLIPHGDGESSGNTDSGGEGTTAAATALPLILAGRCYDRESVPFKAIDSIIDSLVTFLRGGKGRKAWSRWPEDIHFLAQLFPLLRRVEGIAERAADNVVRMDPQKLRYRAFHALKELLADISQEIPLVVLIDDLQWGDADSAQVLVELLTVSDAPSLLFLGSYRSDEADDSPFLQTWQRLTTQTSRHVSTRRVTVQPLNREQCVDLAAIRTGADRELIRQRADELLQDSGGNPYFVEQLMEGFDPTTGGFQHVPLDEIIAGRLRKLPEAASDLLDIIAISGQPVSVDEASQVVGKTAPELGVMTHMRSERLVRLMGSPDQTMVDTYHDKIRETVLAGMSATQRQRLHLQLAETIEGSLGLSAEALLQGLSQSSTPGDYQDAVSPRVVDLALHFSEAGDPRAFVYLVLAGEQALQAYAFEDAIGLYDQAERLLPAETSSTLQFRLWFAMGRVLLCTKQTDRAATTYQKAVDVADNKFDRARAFAGLAGVYRQVAQFDQAIQHYDDALAQLVTRRPRTLVGKLFSFATNSFHVLVIPASWQRQRTKQAVRIALLEHGIVDGLVEPMLEKDFHGAVNAMAEASLAAFQTGDQRLVGMGHALAAQLWSGMGIRWIGNLCLRRSGRIESVLDDPDYRGRLLRSKASACYWGGDVRNATLLFNEAIPLLQRCGNLFGLIECLHMLRHALSYSSRSNSELSAARDVLAVATEADNTQGICWGNYDIASALARKGELADAMAYMERANAVLSGERYNMTEAIRGSTDGYVRLQCSDYQGARELAKTAWELAVSSFVLIDCTLLCLPVLVESVAGANWTSPLPDSDSRYLRRMLRRAALLYPMLPNHQPHLLRVSGRAQYAMGNKRKAIRKFAQAIRLAQKKGMDYQRAKSMLDLAAVQEEDRDQNRRQAVALLKKMESVIPYAERWLLGDMLEEAQDVVAPSPALTAQRESAAQQELRPPRTLNETEDSSSLPSPPFRGRGSE
jgi:eukaryotic-like serine/threonine-protein kinase